MPDTMPTPRLKQHALMLVQETWAITEQIDALRDVAKFTTGSQLKRALNKLAHVVRARTLWLSRVDVSFTAPVDISPTGLTFDQILAEATESEEHWKAYLRKGNDDELSRVVTYTAINGEDHTDTVEDILLHVWSHGFYHRGQIGALINELGGTPPAIDYIVRKRND